MRLYLDPHATRTNMILAAAMYGGDAMQLAKDLDDAEVVEETQDA